MEGVILPGRTNIPIVHVRYGIAMPYNRLLHSICEHEVNHRSAVIL